MGDFGYLTADISVETAHRIGAGLLRAWRAGSAGDRKLADEDRRHIAEAIRNLARSVETAKRLQAKADAEHGPGYEHRKPQQAWVTLTWEQALAVGRACSGLARYEGEPFASYAGRLRELALRRIEIMEKTKAAKR